MGPGNIEAVGGGRIDAFISASSEANWCNMIVLLNGQAGPIFANDGESISVDIQTAGDCNCCKVGMECIPRAGSAPMWIQKSNKENRVMTLNKRELYNKIQIAVNNVSNRKNKLR
jgi:hypothetical protein